jgi:hypothetical protein
MIADVSKHRRDFALSVKQSSRTASHTIERHFVPFSKLHQVCVTIMFIVTM